MLVMLMFVVILGLGPASLLTTLASLVNRRSRIWAHWLHVNWIVLLLLTYFNLFWHSLNILEIEAWGFGWRRRGWSWSICSTAAATRRRAYSTRSERGWGPFWPFPSRFGPTLSEPSWPGR